MSKNLKNTLIIIGIILVILGIIGLVYNYATILMWVLIVLGVIGILWGWLGGSKGGDVGDMPQQQ